MKECNMISPANLKELACALGEKDENVFLIAGGTDLVISFNEGKIEPKLFINLLEVKDLKEVEANQDSLIIGACATFSQLEENPLVCKHFAGLRDACTEIGSKQIRNRGTIGGSLMNASAAGDIFPVLLSLDAKAVVLNEKGQERVLPIDSLITKVSHTALGQKEALIKLVLPIEKNSVNGFVKLGARAKVTISKVNLALNLAVENQIITKATAVLGAVGEKAFVCTSAQSCLVGKKLSQVDTAQLSQVLSQEIDRSIPNRPSRIYKREAVCGLVESLMEKI